MALQQERLQLDRGRSNQSFQSWRLSRGSDASHSSQDVPGHVCVATEDSYDYLHTRASLLDNHLRSEGSTLYSFLRSDVGVCLASFPGAPAHGIEAFRLQHHADMGQGHVEDSPLDCSMAQVQQPTMSSHTLDRPFLLSSGRGDMVLVSGRLTSARSNGTPLQIRKLNGRPFCIEGAWQAAPGWNTLLTTRTGVLRAAVWTLEPKSETQAAACSVHVLTLHAAADLSLTEGDAHLLIRAKLPPHAVIVSAEEDAVALAIDPVKAESLAANPGTAAVSGMATDVGGEDDDMPSPRTLRAAVERLAQYTSEQPDVGPTTQGQGFADIYSEVSPQDEGLSSEPECEIHCYSWSRQAPAPDTPSREEAGSSGAPEPSQAMRPPDGAHEGPRLTAEITCSPLRVLTGQGPDLNRSSALLGLIDDVDCAVVSMAFTRDPASPVQLQHVATIPALAYVATGKTQRKYTLLGEPESGIAAVIVEANRFAYVYHETPPSEPYGTHQVLDLDLPREATVLGAVLETRQTPGGRPSLHILTHDCMKSFKLDI